MDLIPSFTVDHTKLKPGIYVSRIDTLGDEYATTFDIRMKAPNLEPVVHGNAMHTIEHLLATYLRNDDEWADRVIYWGPMGCLTGCYFIVKGLVKSEDILPLMIRAFEWAATYEGEVPGATPESCGNYLFQDLNVARMECAAYVRALKDNPPMEYPA